MRYVKTLFNLSAKWFGINVIYYIEQNADRNQTIAATQELLYQVTGTHLLSRRIIEQFLNFEEVFSRTLKQRTMQLNGHRKKSLQKMEELNQTRRSVADASKSYKPQCDYWQASKIATEKAQRYADFHRLH